MKKKILKGFCLTMCLLMVVTVNGFASSGHNVNQENYMISEAYTYPIVPDTDEWRAFTTHAQMVKACEVPEELLSKMTTEALFVTVMNYPLLTDALAFDEPAVGYEVLKINSNAVRELIKREDAKDIFDKYNSKARCAQVYAESEYSGLIWSCFNLIYNEEFADSIMPLASDPQKVTNTNVKTPNGTKVAHFENLTWANHGLTSAEAEDRDKDFAKKYPSATKISGPKPAYNCHSYAWHSTSTSNNDWIDGGDAKAYWTDGSYKVTNSPKNADKVVYRVGTTIAHSANYFNAATNVVYSKWGFNGVYKHSRSYCPYAPSGTIYSSYTRS